MLPSQDVGAGMLFANAPSRLPVHPWVADDRRADCSDAANSTVYSHIYPGQVNPIEKAGYTVRDIFFLELCVFRQICSNGADVFMLKAGEPFQCKFSHKGFAELQNLLLSCSSPDLNSIGGVLRK